MVVVEYSSSKLVRRALLFFVGGLAMLGTLIGALVGLYLIAYGVKAIERAMASDKVAIVLQARGIEIRTLWRKRFLSYDDYTHVSAERMFFGAAIIPLPGPSMLEIHSNKRGWFSPSTISLPIGFLKLAKGAVPLVGEAIELVARQHRVGGAAWHEVHDKRNAANGVPPPPRQLATAAEREGRAASRRDPLEGAPPPPPPPRQLTIAEERAAARRDPLEGGPRGRLDRPPPGGCGRKIA